MQAIGKTDKTFEETIDDLIRLNKQDSSWREENEILTDMDKDFVHKVLTKRLRGEMRRYLPRADQYAEQIEYIKEQLKKVDDYIQ